MKDIFKAILLLFFFTAVTSLSACGKPKKRTGVVRTAKANTTAGKATVERCQKQNKILSMDGKCVLEGECSAVNNAEVVNGQCQCIGQTSVSDAAKNQCESVAKQPSTKSSDSSKPGPSTEQNSNKPFAELKKGQGRVNLSCGVQARIEILILDIVIDEKVKTLRYSSKDTEFFKEDIEVVLSPPETADEYNKNLKIKVSCLPQSKCSAFVFTASVDASPGFGGQFYGVPAVNCANSKSGDARDLIISADIPKVQTVPAN